MKKLFFASIAYIFAASCKTSLPITKEPVGENCVKITLEYHGWQTQSYYCDSNNLSKLYDILKVK